MDTTLESLILFIIEHCPAEAKSILDVFDTLRDREDHILDDIQISVLDEFYNLWLKANQGKQDDRKWYSYVGTRFK